MSAVLTIPPDGEAVHLDAAKLNLRETDTAQDSKILRAIADARGDAESRTNQVILHSRFALTLDNFPCMEWRRNRERMMDYAPIILPGWPIVRVVSIVYTDTAGASQTFDSANYIVNTTRKPTTITPIYGVEWPSTLSQDGVVSVTYDAGRASLFTADATANTLTVTGPVTWAVNDIVRVSNSGGALPAPLVVQRNYYIKSASAGVYTLAATLGGSTIDLTTAGTGYSFIGEIPEGMVEWMMLRIGSLYSNREELAFIRGNVVTMPFFEGLLDRYIVYL